MFGLFDSPWKNIGKRLPESAHFAFSTASSYASVQLNELDKKKKEYALGVVLSVWAFNNCAAGEFELSEYDLRYIQNLGGNCSRVLDEHSMSVVYKVLDDMFEKGLTPRPPEA